jgi:dTDP-glucose 4,6-dehydratase
MTHSLLVTGGAGFIGLNFVDHWSRRHPGDRIVVLDSLTYAASYPALEPFVVAGKAGFVKGDICDQALVESLIAEHGVDRIVHFAAESHVDRSIEGPDAFVTTNVVGTHSLLKAARRAWLEGRAPRADVRFHHVSTDEVFGSLSPAAPAFTEASPYSPNSPYSASKAASDHLVRAYHHTYGLPVVVTNCSNNYGPYQYPEKLIPLMVVNAFAGKPLPVYGDGSNIRDWLYVEDHCRAIDLVLSAGRVGETYNVGGRSERSNLDVVRRLCAVIDAEFAVRPELGARFPGCPSARGGRAQELVRFVEDRPGHDWRYAVDAGKIGAELGFEPAESFESGLARTVRWLIDHEDWWRRAMDQKYADWVATNYADRK